MNFDKLEELIQNMKQKQEEEKQIRENYQRNLKLVKTQEI
jgi:hypothetical protein